MRTFYSYEARLSFTQVDFVAKAVMLFSVSALAPHISDLYASAWDTGKEFVKSLWRGERQMELHFCAKEASARIWGENVGTSGYRKVLFNALIFPFIVYTGGANREIFSRPIQNKADHDPLGRYPDSRPL